MAYRQDTLRPHEKEWLSFKQKRDPARMPSFSHPWQLLRNMTFEDAFPGSEELLRACLASFYACHRQGGHEELIRIENANFMHPVNGIIERGLNDKKIHHLPVLVNFIQSFSLSEDVAQKNSQTFAKWGGFVAKNFYGDDALFLLDVFKGVPWFRKGFESASWQSLAGKNMEALYRNAGNQEDGSSAMCQRKKDLLLSFMKSLPDVTVWSRSNPRFRKNIVPHFSITGPGIKALHGLCKIFDKEYPEEDVSMSNMFMDKIVSCLVFDPKNYTELQWSETTLAKQGRKICSNFFNMNINEEWLLSYVKKCVEKNVSPPLWAYERCLADFTSVDIVEELYKAPLGLQTNTQIRDLGLGLPEEKRKCLSLLSEKLLKEELPPASTFKPSAGKKI